MVFNRFRNKPDFPTNERLLKAITALATQGMNKAGRAFYTALLESNLLLAEEPYEARPVLFADEDGGVVLPVFTDLPRLRKVFPDAERVAALPSREIFRMALKNEAQRININPEHGPGGFLDRAEIEALAHDRLPDLSGATDRSWDEPDLVPFGSTKLPTQAVIDKMIETAQNLLRREPGVEEAYLILTRSEKGDSVLTIGLRFTHTQLTDDKAIFSQRFVPAIEAVIERPLHMIWLDENDLVAIRQNVEPFYTRSTE